jgi:dimethylhistidine N-methyltransferase
MHSTLQLSSPSRASIIAATPLALEVYRGLTASPKTLSPWLFYDVEGSRLFEEITRLPEYYLTRTERKIFSENADEIIAGTRAVSRADRELTVIELGAGTATKSGLLLAATVRSQGHVTYRPIDVSASALDEARHHLESNLTGVKVAPQVADYTEGLGLLHDCGTQRLVLYIGSSIGNFDLFDAAQLLQELRDQLSPGDCLLLGTDLVKPKHLLLAAYNDATGVTAAFNKNILTRINRELDADFDLGLFRHVAAWNPSKSRIEMHLESLESQAVSIPALDLQIEFEPGETIHTENSYKFTLGGVARLLRRSGFSPVRHWTDSDAWFGVTLASAK